MTSHIAPVGPAGPSHMAWELVTPNLGAHHIFLLHGAWVLVTPNLAAHHIFLLHGAWVLVSRCLMTAHGTCWPIPYGLGTSDPQLGSLPYISPSWSLGTSPQMPNDSPAWEYRPTSLGLCTSDSLIWGIFRLNISRILSCHLHDKLIFLKQDKYFIYITQHLNILVKTQSQPR